MLSHLLLMGVKYGRRNVFQAVRWQSPMFAFVIGTRGVTSFLYESIWNATIHHPTTGYRSGNRSNRCHHTRKDLAIASATRPLTTPVLALMPLSRIKTNLR